MDNYTDALMAVNTINDELIDKYSGKCDGFPPILSITKAHNIFLIALSIPSNEGIELQLFCSENDDRKYYEKTDKYESFYKFLKRKFLLVKEQINSVKL
jgi:hypothetical protein